MSAVDKALAKARAEARTQVLRDMRRLSRPKRVERSAEELAKREEFAQRWEAINEEGQRLGYLMWEGSYEGEWVPDTRAAFSHETQVDYLESEAQYKARVRDAVEARVLSWMNAGRLR